MNIYWVIEAAYFCELALVRDIIYSMYISIYKVQKGDER